MADDTKNGYEEDRWSILPNFRFVFRVEGAFDVALKSIRPFTKENEFEQIEEGGMNDYVHIKRKHVTKPHTIQVERYLTDSFYDPMPNGTAFALPLLLFVGGNRGTKEAKVEFTWAPERVYVFFGAQVMNKEIGGFDAEKSGLLTETITIAYHQLYMMDIPGDMDMESWKFKTEGNKANIANKYANQGMFDLEANKKEKKEFVDAAAANLWEFDPVGGDYLGNGVHWDANFGKFDGKAIDQNKKTLKQFVSDAKANTWHFPKDPSADYIGDGTVHFDDGNIKQNKKSKTAHASLAKRNTWHFSKDSEGDYIGEGPQHFDDGAIPQNKKTEVQMRTTAERNTWHFDSSPDKYTGNGQMHATHPQNELTREKMEAMAKANTWPNTAHAMKYPETKEDFLKR